MKKEIVAKRNVEKQNERLLKALEINHLIAGELHLAPLLKQIMTLSQSIMNCETCSLFLLDEENKELVFHVCSGSNDAQLKEICRLPLGVGIAGWCAEHSQTVRLDDVYADPRFDISFDRQTKFITHNMISTPLYVRNKLVGVCQVINHQDGPFSISDQQLLEALVPMMAIAIDNARAHQNLLEQKIFQHDLMLAKSIQQSFLPEVPLDVAGYQVAFYMRTAFDVGGDFYDMVQMPDGRIAYLVGDISGKGVSAAMLMSSVLSDIRRELSCAGHAGEVLSRFNSVLCKKVKNGMFVSLVLMILEPNTGQLEVANAGHLPPIHMHQGKVWQHNEASGPPAGIVPNIHYSDDTHTLLGDEMLMLYTDGITEARNENGDMIGIDRLMSWLSQHVPMSAQGCVEHLNHCIAQFTLEAKQNDDLTILTLKAGD